MATTTNNDVDMTQIPSIPTQTTTLTDTNSIDINIHKLKPLIPIYLITDDGKSFQLDASFLHFSLLVSSYYEIASKNTLISRIKQEKVYIESRIENIANEISKLQVKDTNTIEQLKYQLESYSKQYKDQETIESLATSDIEEIERRKRIE
jgi:hypothetical protein